MKTIATSHSDVYYEIEELDIDFYMVHSCSTDYCKTIGRFETEEEAVLAAVKAIYRRGLAIA